MTTPRYKRFREIVGISLLSAGLVLVGYGLYIPLKATLAQVLLERAWNAASLDKPAPKPWPWADTRPVARINFDALNKTAIVLSGAHGRSLPFGPGHVYGTAEPGEHGHSVIAAHRDTHFSFLGDVRVGMVIDVERPGGENVRYIVVETGVLDTRKETILIDHSADTLSLVTCYPFKDWDPGGPLRYVVTALGV